jgi:UDP-N-acetylmuramate-alanine ligase
VDIPALLRTFSSDGKVSYAPRGQLAQHLCARLGKGDLLLTLGAGDITAVANEVLAMLERQVGA